MFEHLDDPKPPPPRRLLVELVVAEGARRRRRRVTVAGGVAATLLVLAGGVRLAQAAGSGGDPDLRVVPPAESSPDSRGEGEESGDGLSTTQGPDEGAASTTPGGGAPTPPGATTFAGLTTDDEVVLGDTSAEGGLARTLVEAPTDGTKLGDQVALSPDRQTVYYEVLETGPAGDEAGGSAIFKMNTEGDPDPERVDTGSSPAVSHESGQLAYVQTSDEGIGIVVRGESDDATERFFRGPTDGTRIDGLAFTADDKSLVYVLTPPDGPAVVRVIDLNFSLSVSFGLGDAEGLVVADQEAPGTVWSSPDARATDGTVGLVQTCCELEPGVETTFTFVDPATHGQTGDLPADGVSGTVVRSSYDDEGHNQLVLAVDDGEAYSLYLRRDDGPLERLDDGARYKAIDW